MLLQTASFFTLCINSILLTTVGSYILKRQGDEPGPWITLGYVVWFAVAGTATMIPFAIGGGNYAGVVVKISVALIVYLPSAYLLSQMLGGFIGGGVANKLYGSSSIISVPPSAYGKAFALAREGSPVAAARAFRTYHDQNPAKPDPLFHAAKVLEDGKYYREAGALYKEIIHTYTKHPAVCAEATIRYAELLSGKMGNTPDALRVLKKISGSAYSPAMRHRSALFSGLPARRQFAPRGKHDAFLFDEGL